jgi:hypothetical protein
MSQLWKDTERYIAKVLGGQRIPVNSTSGVACDVSTPLMSVEVKERVKIPIFLSKTVQQAETNCEKGKIATVVLHEKGKGHDKDLVIMRLRDFCDLYGKATVIEVAER